MKFSGVLLWLTHLFYLHCTVHRVEDWKITQLSLKLGENDGISTGLCSSTSPLSQGCLSRCLCRRSPRAHGTFRILTISCRGLSWICKKITEQKVMTNSNVWVLNGPRFGIVYKNFISHINPYQSKLRKLSLKEVNHHYCLYTLGPGRCLSFSCLI